MVKPDKASAKDLFDSKVHYEIPPYQRPYVWNEEEQWAPLWDDIVRVAESHIRTDDDKRTPTASHFLGAVVFELTEARAAGIDHYDVIDGQQRLTTLQILLDAAEQVMAERALEDESEVLSDLILNSQPRYKGTPERFKLWPSRADRSAFESAMDPSGAPADTSHQIVKAHRFFVAEVERWVSGAPDEMGEFPPGDEATRAAELCETLSRRLMFITIDLSEEDDSQLIFETLNDRGTPLLKADLIKNWVFREGKKIGADVDYWASNVWDDFDTEWWRAEIAQGRLVRSRVDIFLQYWLTMRTLDEVKSDLVFRLFTDYASSHMKDVDSAEGFLRELRADADTYRNLAALEAATAAGRFRIQVIEAMELAATMPVFLWFISENHGIPDQQVALGLEALSSWAIRRTLLRLTSKDVNRLMIAILKELAPVDPAESGQTLHRYLSAQTADSRFWPSDEALAEMLPTLKIYGQIKQSRLRAVLGEIEHHRRSLTPMHESVPVPSGLSIEHVMPQEWRSNWDSDPKLDQEAAQKRDHRVNRLGNLTLTTQSLNSSLSNRPWTDAAAEGMSQGGQAGRGKRALLQSFSLLVLNKEIVDDHEAEWTEDDIVARSRALTDDIIAIWPGPDTAIQAQEYERARAEKG